MSIDLELRILRSSLKEIKDAHFDLEKAYKNAVEPLISSVPESSEHTNFCSPEFLQTMLLSIAQNGEFKTILMPCTNYHGYGNMDDASRGLGDLAIKWAPTYRVEFEKDHELIRVTVKSCLEY